MLSNVAYWKSAGFDDVLLKPLNRAALLNALDILEDKFE
jgi:hypothetical protein